MTVRELMNELLDLNLDYEVVVTGDYFLSSSILSITKKEEEEVIFINTDTCSG